MFIHQIALQILVNLQVHFAVVGGLPDDEHLNRETDGGVQAPPVPDLEALDLTDCPLPCLHSPASADSNSPEYPKVPGD